MRDAIMSLQDSDISWQMLRRIVHDWVGTSAELAEVKRLDGGCINTTLALTTQAGDRAVLKISPHRVNRQYLTEAYQLNILRAIGLPAPQVYVSTLGDLDDPISYLLMEFVDGIDLNHAREQCTDEQFDHLQMHLAELMLTLHNNTHETYTRLTEGEREEFTPGRPFTATSTIHTGTSARRTPRLPSRCARRSARSTSASNARRPRRLPAPGALGRLVDQHPLQIRRARAMVGLGLLDPNCKYAHAEAEIAYMDLFHTITPAFLRAYQQPQA